MTSQPEHIGAPGGAGHETLNVLLLCLLILVIAGSVVVLRGGRSAGAVQDELDVLSLCIERRPTRASMRTCGVTLDEIACCARTAHPAHRPWPMKDSLLPGRQFGSVVVATPCNRWADSAYLP
ncbi:hypothetical protein ACXX9E_29540 [Pseudomonas sp. GNP014]